MAIFVVLFGDFHCKTLFAFELWLLNGCCFADTCPIISTEPTIRALQGQQSAVHCLSSRCGGNFPQNSLVFALLRALASADSVHLFRSFDPNIFNGRFQSQAGPPQVHVSTPLKGCIIGSPAARSPFW